MNYRQLVNHVRTNVEYTATALSDSVAMLSVGTIGVLSAVPEAMGLYLSTVDKIAYSASVSLSAALPAISVACVSTAMTTKQSRYWWLFGGQLVISMAIAYSLGGSWELLLIPCTGAGAWIAAANYNVSRETKRQAIDDEWKREEEAKDNETKRQIQLMKAKAKAAGQDSGQTADTVSKRTRAHQLSTEGYNQTEIANLIGVSDRTVRRYLSGDTANNVRPTVHLNGETK